MEPLDAIVAAEPCHLLTRIDAAVLLNLLNGKLQRAVTVEVGKQLLVAYGVE